MLAEVVRSLDDGLIERLKRSIERPRLTYEQFNKFCAALPGATHVVQWGGSHVWKVGGKVFAIGGWADDKPAFTFKVTPIAYEVLKDRDGLRPAPYLASRGMKWIQQHKKPGFSDGELKEHLRISYELVAASLPKKQRDSIVEQKCKR